MLCHYLKVAFRSFAKYKQQTIISIVGLAVGFVCFALAVMWIRYERSFDKFHPGYERIFAVVRVDEKDERGISTNTPRPLSQKLKELFPEIEEACSTSYFSTNMFAFNDREVQLNKVEADSNFFKLFGISLKHRKTEAVLSDENFVAITNKCVEELSPDGNLNLGDRFNYKLHGEENAFVVNEIVEAWPQNTNFPFDIVFPLSQDFLEEWRMSYLLTFVKVREGVDVEKFKKKVESYNFAEAISLYVKLVPVSEWYYTVNTENRSVKYQYIVLFSFAGLLVILCALFNYLALFVSRLRMRGKEIVLRKMSGADNRQLLKQLLIEFLLILFFSVLSGFLLIEWVFPAFQSLAVINLSKLSVFFELFIYVLFLVFVSVLVALYPILYFQKCTVQSELSGNSARLRNAFSRVCIWIQFGISIFFIFCTVVMICQIYHLNHVDLGFSRKNIVQILPMGGNKTALLNELKNLSTVKQATGLSQYLFLPSFGWASAGMKNANGQNVDVEIKRINSDVMEMLEIRLKEGEMIVPGSRDVLLNESAVNELGESFVKDSFPEVKGIVRDFLFESPLMKSRPFKLCYDNDSRINLIMVKYQDGTRYQTEKAIMELMKSKFDNAPIRLYYMEDEYDKYLKSERSLIFLLSILSVVCVLVASFGIYSMVSLACERRRKEIAVRKINGAGIVSLLLLFMKEYFYLLLSASAVAFLVGYKVMQSWIEKYINRIDIGAWMYVVVFLFVALLVVSIIVYRVWRSLQTNPVEELKRG